MIRRFLQKILTRPVSWLANRFSSRPNRERVHAALSELYQDGKDNPGKKVLVVNTSVADARFIIFSDQHKGAKDGSDDFMICEQSYITALEYYYDKKFHFISLGDEEELWENTLGPVKENNQPSIALQKKFLQQQHYTKVFGNHDIFWNNDPFAANQIKNMYDEPVKIYEAVLLNIETAKGKLEIFLTHGHQGDGQSDGNWFSAWFVGRIWVPLQTYLYLNPNIPSASEELKTAHNLFMYQWSEQEQHPVLVTGHTHQPVFASLTHLEKLYRNIDEAKRKNDQVTITSLSHELQFKQHEYDFVVGNYTNTKPYYFNSGCCCFSDGDITGIEIAEGKIRLIKWDKKETISERKILDEMDLAQLL